jgi:two-component system chemotaxis response regulator CheB
VLSCANPLFESARRNLGRRAIAVVLTGYGRDATDGVQAVKEGGGVVIAQDEESSRDFGMPGSAIETGAVDYVRPLEKLVRSSAISSNSGKTRLPPSDGRFNTQHHAVS